MNTAFADAFSRKKVKSTLTKNSNGAHCSHPVYTSKGRAQTVADEYNRKEPGANYRALLCKGCGKFRVEKGETTEGVELADRIAGRNYFRLYRDVTLCKAKVQEDQYIFVVSPTFNEWDTTVLTMGILIASRKNHGNDFLDLDGKVDPNTKLYHSLPNLIAKEVSRAKHLLGLHEDYMMTFDDAQAWVKQGFGFDNIEEKAGAKRPSAAVASERPLNADSDSAVRGVRDMPLASDSLPEMWNGRAVWRTEDGKPFHREYVKCVRKGCCNEIELRAYITRDAEGAMVKAETKKPADKGVHVMGSHSQKEYTCVDCVTGVSETSSVANPTPPMPEEGKAAQGASEGLHSGKTAITGVCRRVLDDLRRLSPDPEIDPEFIRGMSIMAGEIMAGGEA